jgi:hypothetical protein
MSNTVLNAVFESSQSKGMDRLVLVAIADRADDSGAAWCGTEDIARRVGIARNHVTRHTKKLVALGELEVGMRQGRHRTNLYRVVLRPSTAPSRRGTVPPRSKESPTMVQNPSHHGTQTQGTPKNPSSAKRERFDATCVDLPFSSDPFREAWETWCRHRREKRQPLTPTATRQQLAKLEAMGEARAIAAIAHSVENGYQGIFEPKGASADRPRFSPIGVPLNDAAHRRSATRSQRCPL